MPTGEPADAGIASERISLVQIKETVMAAKKTTKRPKAVKPAARKRSAKPAGKRSTAAKKPAKKAPVKQSAPTKASATKKTTPQKRSAAVAERVNKPTTEKAPKLVTKQRAAQVQEAKDPEGATRKSRSPTARPAKRTSREAAVTTIGFIGAGHIGSQLARLAMANGYNVVISNSRGPETLSALVEELGPRARAATAVDAATAGDIVVVTIPLKNYRQVSVEPLAGKIVIDTNNYYPQRDGHIAELDNESTTTSELLQAHLPTSKVVKTFNHIYAAALTTDGQPAGTENRRALAIAGDDPKAKGVVARLLDQFGFDTVDAGPLKEGWRFQRDTPGYGPRRTAEELRNDLAAAKRYADH
jgi:predicted dinucleotide-binding enzyme